MSGTDPQQRLEALADDLDVRRVITDYAALIDAREFTRLRDVFAEEAVVDYHNGRSIVSGADRLVEYIRENTAHLAWQHHFVSVYGVDVDGDDATALAYLISHQVIEAEPTHVLMMAARYEFGLRRDDRWRIASIVHTIQLTNFHPITVDPPVPVAIPPAVRPGT